MPKKKVAVILTSQNYDLIHNVALTHAINLQLNNNDWDNVRLVLCEPSIELFSTNQELKRKLNDLREHGIELQGCKSNNYSNIKSMILAELGIDEVYMIDPIKEYKEANWAVLVF